MNKVDVENDFFPQFYGSAFGIRMMFVAADALLLMLILLLLLPQIVKAGVKTCFMQLAFYEFRKWGIEDGRNKTVDGSREK